MSKARDLLNKTGGSGGMFPAHHANKPLGGKSNTEDHGVTGNKPPSADPNIKSKTKATGVGKSPTSVRPKV